MRNGIGTFTWVDGSTYQGGFLADNREGFGVLKQQDLEWCGNWATDVKNGFGT